MSEIISVTKEELIQLIGEKNISKLRKAFPDVFNEKMHEIPSITVTQDDEMALITIGHDLAFNSKHMDRCLVLHPDYNWKVTKRYDEDGNYRTYLIPTLKTAASPRKRRRKTAKTTKSKVA